jgi:hypothetical protein
LEMELRAFWDAVAVELARRQHHERQDPGAA